MFSSTRLHAFVCIALGIAVSAAPARAPATKVDARSPDVYNLGGGLAGLILGLDAERAGSGGDEDTYILKRQLDNPDISSRLGSNVGLAHAAGLGNSALGLADGIKARSPDTYDLNDGVVGLLLGLEGERAGTNADEDTYILKRQLAALNVIGSTTLAHVTKPIPRADDFHPPAFAPATPSPPQFHPNDDDPMNHPKRDLYDLDGGFVGLLLGLDGERNGASGDEDTYILKRQLAELLFGLDGENYGGDSDEDTYILKRQLDGLDLGSRIGGNAGVAHAAELGSEGALALGDSKRDVYDLSGGLAALLFGIDGEGYGGDSDEDVYVLKRQLARPGLDIGSRLSTNMGLAHAASLGESTFGGLGEQ